MPAVRPLFRSRGNIQFGSLATLVPIAIVLILLFALVGGMVVVVQAGHVGVVKRLGAVQPEPLRAGLHIKRPFMDQVEMVDIRLQGAEAKATAASRDLQTVSTDVTVQYSLAAELAPNTYARVGDSGAVSRAIIAPGIQETVKAVTARFTAEELVTERGRVKTEIQEALNQFIDTTLKQKDLQGSVLIANMAITEFRFSEDFNRAIEAKVKAEQQALQARNEKLRLVTQAEAAAEQKKLGADAEAYTIETQSKARADAIKREAEALANSPQLIRLRAVEKWDGTLPRMTGDSAIPFINVDSLGGLPANETGP